jgi:hypothetical protein
MHESGPVFERRGVLPRRGEDEIQIDWLLILLGPFDASKGARAGGLVDKVSQVAEYVTLSRRIDSWLIRGIGFLAIVKWFGLDHVEDILKMFGVYG